MESKVILLNLSRLFLRNIIDSTSSSGGNMDFTVLPNLLYDFLDRYRLLNLIILDFPYVHHSSSESEGWTSPTPLCFSLL